MSKFENRGNSLFDTLKTANSFLGPRKLNIPYLTPLQKFHSQYDIPYMSETLENHSKSYKNQKNAN